MQLKKTIWTQDEKMAKNQECNIFLANVIFSHNGKIVFESYGEL
jgi:hypothetical protein